MDRIDAAEGWNRWLGCAWARMLRSQRLSPTGTVAEIGPGFTDKIARGLAALGFRGTVVLIEPNPAASTWAAARYRHLLPQAKLIVVQRPIPKGRLPRSHSVEALLSNHILDDLILNAALPSAISARIFARMQPGLSCSPLFIRRWRALLARAERLESLLAQVAADFTDYVAELQPRLVLLNQYPSWRHNLHGLDAIHTQALRLMRLIAAGLDAVCVNAAVVPDSSPSSAVRWLIGKPNGDL